MPSNSKARIRIFVREYVCRYCPAMATTWDHAHPRSRGGNNVYWEPEEFMRLHPKGRDSPNNGIPNLFPCCAACNNDKGNMTHEEYLHLLYLREQQNWDEVDRHSVICKIRAISEKIEIMKRSISRVETARQLLSKESRDDSMILKDFPNKVDEMANSRLHLCVKALEKGIPFNEIARMLGKLKHRSKLRNQLKIRGYSPRV